MSKKDRKKDREIVETAAERLAEIFVRQIELKKKSKNNNKQNYSFSQNQN